MKTLISIVVGCLVCAGLVLNGTDLMPQFVLEYQ